ncbi:MAG: roadblock/LC7 domain-containing protein [Candidatus Hodarchaeota archaeon]
MEMRDMSKKDVLESILDNFFLKRLNEVTTFVVTNERGLIIVDKAIDGISTSSLAAMTSLMSHTTNRVNKNLNLGEWDLISLSSSKGVLYIKTFEILSREFQLGALLNRTERLHRLRWLRRRRRNIENDLEAVIKEIKEIIERD